MAATNSAFRTETRDEHLYNHIELFNRSSSQIDAPAANRCQDCRERQPTETQIATGRRVFGDYRTEPSNEHLYYNIQSINKPSSPATESQGANQTSQDDRRRQQPTGNSNTMGRRVLSALIAVLALAFLAMLASLIATAMVHVMKSGTNGGHVLDNIQQKLKDVEKTISLLVDQKFANNMVVKIIRQVSSNQTEGRRLLETKIEDQTSELNQVIPAGCQDGRILNDTQQQLNEVLENLNDTVATIIDKVSSYQTEERLRLLETKVGTLIRMLNHSKDPWIKIKKSPIPFGLIDNKLSSCFIVPSNGTLAAVKLVHAYGYVTCNDNNLTYWWDCGGNKKDVTVVIKKETDGSSHTKTFSTEEGEHSLRIPGYSPLSSELVLSYLSDPPKVIEGQKLCLSYLGDTKAGKSSFDVYARFE